MATKLSGTLGSATTSAASDKIGRGEYTVSLSGSGTVKLEVSTDGGTTWTGVSSDATGTLASFAVTTSGMYVVGWNEEPSAVYRFNCTAYTSTITYRLAQNN